LSAALTLQGATAQQRHKPLRAEGVRWALGHTPSAGELMFERITAQGAQEEGQEEGQSERSTSLSWPLSQPLSR
jgi:hypothetical protein